MTCCGRSIRVPLLYNQFQCMRKSIVILFLFLLASVSCVHEPLAQDLPSLQGTKWKYAESEIWEGGSYSFMIYLDFRDEETVVYRYEYKEKNAFGTQLGNEEFRYIYRYDLSVKQGIFIYEDGNTVSFELRGNLLLLTMTHDTYIFRRE